MDDDDFLEDVTSTPPPPLLLSAGSDIPNGFVKDLEIEIYEACTGVLLDDEGWWSGDRLRGALLDLTSSA